MDRAVEILQDLIRIPSVNPDGDPGTDGVGELACATWVGKFLHQLGADVVLEDVLPSRPNVIGRFPTSGSGKPRILLAPHTDTVSVGGMTVSPFGGEVRDGKVWGRGASDTKGTMAAMLAALEKIGTEGIAALPYEVMFVGFMSEESSQFGSKHFVKHHGSEVDFAIIGEPTDCAVVHAHKGCLWTTLATCGISCHGSTPERGENAISKMASVITALDTTFRRQLAAPAFRHAMLGDSTLNIGMVRGGNRANIVPDQCTLTLDMRITPGLHRHGARALLETFLAEHGWTESVQIVAATSCAPMDTDPGHPLVKKLARIGQGLTASTWFSDAAWLSAGGIPAVAAGPGSIAQAHTADEFLRISDLLAGVDFYHRFLTLAD